MRGQFSLLILTAILGTAPSWAQAAPTVPRHPAPVHHSSARPAHSKPRHPGLARPDQSLAASRSAPRHGYAQFASVDPNAPERLSLDQPLGSNELTGSLGYQRDRVGALDAHEVNSAAGVQLDRSYSLVGASVSN